jgi:hypothetical protein
MTGSRQRVHSSDCCIRLIASHCPLTVFQVGWRTLHITRPISAPHCNPPSGWLPSQPPIGCTKWRTQHSHAPSIGFVCKCEVLRLGTAAWRRILDASGSRQNGTHFALSAFPCLQMEASHHDTALRTAMDSLQLNSFTYSLLLSTRLCLQTAF